jgi:hypothetical protein
MVVGADRRRPRRALELVTAAGLLRLARLPPCSVLIPSLTADRVDQRAWLPTAHGGSSHKEGHIRRQLYRRQKKVSQASLPLDFQEITEGTPESEHVL